MTKQGLVSVCLEPSERDVDLNKSSSVSALWGFGKTRSFLLEISVAQVRLVLGVGCCLELDEKEHTCGNVCRHCCFDDVIRTSSAACDDVKSALTRVDLNILEDQGHGQTPPLHGAVNISLVRTRGLSAEWTVSTVSTVGACAGARLT
ncbi:hypothetical protein RRG08_011647 [Elysia crispata]|uniref:Uncharacterized protein n=1 Tax=Elysia crispata TaxID=231223 RepID=A0AAE0YK04_9GAST|nr:hypothetical protein RRG08_011647 [Elysia crispata]